MKIKFKRDTAFRKTFFVPDSFAHPAKMDAQLLIWIVEHYSKEGETILDPMAGSGTMMLACTLGRHCILVELEEKFCKMMRDNWEQVKMRPQLGSTMGSCEIIQGDARQLEGLVDKIVTSPPFHGEAVDNRKTLNDTIRNLGGMGQAVSEKYSEDNIANLPYGEIDKCIFSPPYAENPGTPSLGSVNKDDWGNEGKDIVARRGLERGYSKDTPNQIGNLPYGQIDKIVTSPPYENQIHKGSAQPGPGGNVVVGDDYVKSVGNIGNLKSDSYLEAMLQVYQSCYSVLRDGGLMVLVTKNFIRNKQVIRLDTDTIKLCEQVGFSFVERHYRELPSQSFWRVIYHQKHPEVEQIKSEDVLVFRK